MRKFKKLAWLVAIVMIITQMSAVAFADDGPTEAELLEQIAAAEEEAKPFQDEVTRIEGEIETVKGEIETLKENEEDTTEKDKELEDLEADLKAAKADLKPYEDKIVELQGQLAALTAISDSPNTRQNMRWGGGGSIYEATASWLSSPYNDLYIEGNVISIQTAGLASGAKLTIEFTQDVVLAVPDSTLGADFTATPTSSRIVELDFTSFTASNYSGWNTTNLAVTFTGSSTPYNVSLYENGSLYSSVAPTVGTVYYVNEYHGSNPGGAALGSTTKAVFDLGEEMALVFKPNQGYAFDASNITINGEGSSSINFSVGTFANELGGNPIVIGGEVIYNQSIEKEGGVLLLYDGTSTRASSDVYVVSFDDSYFEKTVDFTATQAGYGNLVVEQYGRNVYVYPVVENSSPLSATVTLYANDDYSTTPADIDVTPGSTTAVTNPTPNGNALDLTLSSTLNDYVPSGTYDDRAWDNIDLTVENFTTVDPTGKYEISFYPSAAFSGTVANGTATAKTASSNTVDTLSSQKFIKDFTQVIEFTVTPTANGKAGTGELKIYEAGNATAVYDSTVSTATVTQNATTGGFVAAVPANLLSSKSYTVNASFEYQSTGTGGGTIGGGTSTGSSSRRSSDDGTYVSGSNVRSSLTEVNVTPSHQTWYGESSGLRWTISDTNPLALVSVRVDDEEIDRDNYTVRSGSTIVTLKASYLQTLSRGEHTISFRFLNSRGDATFSVQPTGSSGSSSEPSLTSSGSTNYNPSTGAATAHIPMLVVMGMMVCAAAVFPKKK